MQERLVGLDREDEAVAGDLLTLPGTEDPGRPGDGRHLDTPRAHSLLILRPAGEVCQLCVGETPDAQSVAVLLPAVHVAGVWPHLRLLAPAEEVPGHHGLGVSSDVTHQLRADSLARVDPASGGGDLGGVCNVVINMWPHYGPRVTTALLERCHHGAMSQCQWKQKIHHFWKLFFIPTEYETFDKTPRLGG